MKKQTLLIIIMLLFCSSVIFAQEAVRTISGGVVNGKAISLPAPAYPAAAQAVGASGAVSVQVLIDEDGNVVSATAVSGHPLLRSAAEGAARNAKFRPTMLSGQSVKVSGVITYVFNLPKTEQNDEGGAATAGDIPSNTIKSIEEEKAKFDYLVLGAIIRLLLKMNADENLDAASQLLFSTLSKELESSDMPEEFDFKELTTSSRERRAEIITTFSSVLRSSASSNQSWYITFGEDAGDLIAETMKRTIIGGNGSSATKAALAKLKSSLKSAPPDFPADLRSALNNLIEFSEQNNLADVDILSELDDKIMEMGDILFESNEENQF